MNMDKIQTTLMIFIPTLILTGILTRLVTHHLHNPNEYNKHTITGYLREKSGYEIHHIHFGFLITTLVLVWIYFYSINNISAITLAIGISLIIDQIYPYLNLVDYFDMRGILLSILNHLIMVITTLIMF